MSSERPDTATGAAATDHPASSTLTAKTVSGLQWTYLATAVSAVMQIIYAGVMGRLLEPAAFGLVAASMLVINFGNTFAKMGVGQALIQKRDLSTAEVRAGFTSTVVLGALVVAVIWLLSPLLAVQVLRQPDVVPVLRATSVSLLLASASITSESLIRRTMRFRQLAIRNMASYIVGYFAVGIGLALAGAGVWSLVGAALTSSGLRSLLTFAMHRHPVRPVFDWKVYRPLYGFGGQVSIISMMEYLGQNLDTVAVSRYLSAALLGQYNRAYFLVSVPVNQLLTSLSTVLFPGFSAVQHEPLRLRRAYLTALGTSAAIFVPMCAGMAVAANEIVLVALGPRWTPVIEVLPLFAFATAFKVLSHFGGVVCEAQGELRKKMALQALYLLLLTVLLASAVGGGLRAYAAAFLGAKAFQHVGYLFVLRRVLHVPWGDFGQIHLRSGLAALVISGGILLVRLGLLEVGTPLALVLAAEVAVGALGLAAMLRAGPLRPLGRDLLGRLEASGGGNVVVRGMKLLLGGR